MDAIAGGLRERSAQGKGRQNRHIDVDEEVSTTTLAVANSCKQTIDMRKVIRNRCNHERPALLHIEYLRIAGNPPRCVEGLPPWVLRVRALRVKVWRAWMKDTGSSCGVWCYTIDKLSLLVYRCISSILFDGHQRATTQPTE